MSQLDDADRLLDMISSADSKLSEKPIAAGAIYPDYYSISKLMTGINAGTLHRGSFNVSPYNFLEGSATVPAFERPLLILGRENINRAIQGDVVVVELLPKDQWKAPSTKMIDEETVNRDDNAETEEVEAVFTEREGRQLQEEVKRAHGQSREGRSQPTARVVGVTKRNWRQYVGHLDPGSVGDTAKQSRRQQTVFLLPMDKRIPKIRLRTRQAGELLGKRLLVTIDSWDRESRYPVGHFVRSLGEVESKVAETEALLLEYDVQYRPFPVAVLECLPSEGHDWRVPAAATTDPGWVGRRDLRDLPVCSIDPPGCQDIDDALHARPLPNGNIEVGVHIADVSHFVKPDNAMDAEASGRGTTVYLVDKRIDMLPSLLGTDLCSLKPYVERYAFSALWEMTKEAHVVSVAFSKSVIRSREAFSYELAQRRIDDGSQQDELTRGMRLLMALSKKLRQRRMDAGALNLASPEVRIQTESETSDPVDVETKKMLDTNSLVEEFMLLANISVAHRVHQQFPQTALLRRHPTPPSTSFDELAAQLRVRRGMALDASSSKALADSLDCCVEPSEPFFNTLVRILATRCMTSAEYFCAGSHREAEFRHYGLATEIYTHFTSPIRRYADLVVHRQLAAALSEEQQQAATSSVSSLEAVCGNLNRRHRNAQFAGRASIEYYVGQALKSRRANLGIGMGANGKAQDERFEGFVIRVFSNGVVVYVPRFGIESAIRVEDIERSIVASMDENPSESTRIVGIVRGKAETVFDPDEYTLDVSVGGGAGAAGAAAAAAAGEGGGGRGRSGGPKKTVSNSPTSRKLEIFGKVLVTIRDEKDETTGKRKIKMALV